MYPHELIQCLENCSPEELARIDRALQQAKVEREWLDKQRVGDTFIATRYNEYRETIGPEEKPRS
jgi:hypothetical protein